MNNNEKFTLIIISMGCTFGLAIFFLPSDKAALYASIPNALVTGAFTYLGRKNNDDQQ